MALAVAGLCGRPAEAAFFDDGATHTVNDSATGQYGVDIADSATGQDTTVNIVDPAEIGLAISAFGVAPDPQNPIANGNSIRLISANGGDAILNFSGGTTVGAINSFAGQVNLSGGTIGFDPGNFWSLRLGFTELAMSGGELESSIYANDSCLTVTGGLIGGDPGGGSIFAQRSAAVLNNAALAGGIYAIEQTQVMLHNTTVGEDIAGESLVVFQSIAEIEGGNFDAGVTALDGSRVTITGDATFGENFTLRSIEASGGGMGVTRVEVFSGTFAGGVQASAATRIRIHDGTFGAASASRSIIAGSPDQLAKVRVDDGSFGGMVVASANSRVTIDGGSFGQNVLESLQVSASIGEAHATVNGGTFASAVRAGQQARVRLNGGDFGQAISDDLSISARTDEGTAVVDVFGGSYSGAFRAGTNGLIRVYGTGLQISSGVLSGTLADGTPINAEVITADNGQIQLLDPTETPEVPEGYTLLQASVGAVLNLLTFPLPSPPPPPCGDHYAGPFDIPLNPVPIDPDILPGPVPRVEGADLIIRRIRDAINPGISGDFRDTIPIELVALQLQSAAPVDLSLFGGRGTGQLFLTLQSQRSAAEVAQLGAGGLSLGNLELDFAMQMYDASFDLFFDVRAGAVDGEILLSLQDLLSTPAAVPWALEGMDFISGALATSLTQFSFEGQFLEYVGQQVVPAPEPTVAGLTALAAGILASRRRRAQRHE